jgi:hypothetical protein
MSRPHRVQRGDHSSRSRIAPGLKQPTRGSQRPLLRAKRIRAGPALPSYLALLHAGFSVPRMSPPGRWALTPPFHPCQMRSTETGGLVVFPQACRRGASITGGLFSVALSVAVARSPEAANGGFERRSRQPPGVTRRVALPWPALSSSPRLESGLSSRSPRLRGANRRSPGSPATNIITLNRGFQSWPCLGGNTLIIGLHGKIPK